MLTGKRLARHIAQELYTKLANDITLLDVRSQCSFTNYFLIVSARNPMHIDALAERVSEIIDEKSLFNAPRDGGPESGWIIFDFGDLIVHIFSPQARGYYNLESYWGEAKTVELEFKVPAEMKIPAKKNVSRQKKITEQQG